MDVNEILLRVVRGHWRLLLAGILVPLIVVGAVSAMTPRTYVSTARLQASTALPGTDTEADAILNRVTGIATSPAVVKQAVTQASVPRDPQSVIDEVSVTRLGSSAVFDLTVADTDPAVATSLTQALVEAVVQFNNNGGDPTSAQLLQNLADHEKQLLDQRSSVSAQFADARDPAAAAALSARLSDLDQQLNAVGGTLERLQASTSSGFAVVLSPATPATPAPSHLATDLGLGLVIGLVAGLLVASISETIRPRVVHARAFGRELGVPLLGRIRLRSQGDEFVGTSDPEIGLSVGRAAQRAGVRRLAVAGPLESARIRAVAAALQTQTPTIGTALGGLSAAAHLNGSSDHGLPEASIGEAEAQRGAVTETAILAASREVSGVTPQRVEVVAAVDVAGIDPAGPFGLVVVVPPGVLYADLRPTVDLGEACGWPIVGVLDVSAARRDEAPTDREEEHRP
ncbi:hypothetical protein ACQP04_29350 [Pseudonocardia halophobica]|uniref:hypothetical protein n=1 Tax=Pseudonocardia halophobica TaxID=29401 RepID=UPI003D9396B9